jgi:hypothetical protein
MGRWNIMKAFIAQSGATDLADQYTRDPKDSRISTSS